MNILLVLFSTQMYVNLGESNFFLDVLMGTPLSTQERHRTRDFVGALMANYVQQREPPSEQSSSSLIQLIGATASGSQTLYS